MRFSRIAAMTAAPPGIERRAHPRVPLATKVEAESEGRSFIAITCDISSGGMMIFTANPIPEGETVQLTFALPGAEQPLRIQAVVRHVVEGKGMGLQFDSLSEKDRAAIRAFLATQ